LALFSSRKFQCGRESATPRQNGFVVNPNDPASSFINVHLDTTLGKDAESLEVFVDNQNFSGQVRTWSYGGFTPALDALHTEISNHNGTAKCPDTVNNPGCFDLEPPVFSDGVRNGVLPNGVSEPRSVSTEQDERGTILP